MIMAVDQALVSSHRDTGPLPSRTQRVGARMQGLAGPEAAEEWTSKRTSALIAMNASTPTDEMAASVVRRLRLHELRWLAEDILKASLHACQTGATDELASTVVSWIETADIVIGERRRLRHILRARQEGRERFGNPSL